MKAIYLMLEEEIEAETHVPDEATIRDLDRRSKSFLDVSAKMYSLQEAKKIARDRLKVKNR